MDRYLRNNNNNNNQYGGHRFYMAIIFLNLLMCTIVYYITITSFCRIIDEQHLSKSLLMLEQQQQSKFKQHLKSDNNLDYTTGQHLSRLSNYVQISSYLKTNLDVFYDYFEQQQQQKQQQQKKNFDQKQSSSVLNYYDKSIRINKEKIFINDWYHMMYALIERLDNFDHDHVGDGNKHLYWQQQQQNKLKDLIWNKIDQLQNPKKYLLMKMDVNNSNNNNNNNKSFDEIKQNNNIDNKNKKIQLPHEKTTTNDCKSINKLICDSYKVCGFGCSIHHIAYCLIAALALNRTLILSDTNGIFGHFISSKLKSPFNFYDHHQQLFKSINSICDVSELPDEEKPWLSNAVDINIVINQKFETISKQKSNEDDDDDKIESIYLPIIENLDKKAKFRPLAIPEQLRTKLEQITRFPFVVFLGSILSYILRMNNEFEQKFRQYQKRIKFRTNDDDIIIGIHVRRTDKLRWEDAITGKKMEKRERKVYLATDDINVWQKEVPEYIRKGYRFLGDSKITKSASVNNRFSLDSFEGFIIDVLSLSYTDYLVCTFSSQVCRLAYELMQVQRTNGRDMSTHFYSLDDVYYFGGQISHRMESIMANHNIDVHNNDPNISINKQHQFNVGDSLGIEQNLHNGYYVGDLHETKTNRRLHNSLSYPIFKVIEKIDSTSFKAFE
ncbi:alpha-(1,6)-fucosyltransferase-like isoform X2 [Dermatophagoides pteronyssinus]|uniref:alpha-(1,6)-fucosyltransferase-like isoform X2 n=1 Tax=Dermatophagoides pteronyssinus TaxID=6956 RepID=UPI003F668395